MTIRRNCPLVLVVEDDPEMTAEVQGALELAYNLQCTGDVAHARQAVQQSRPDVVVVDCHVAGDDVDNLKALAARAGSGVVLICRSPELLPHLNAFFQCPSLCKPLDRREVLSAVDCAIRNRVPLPPRAGEPDGSALEI